MAINERRVTKVKKPKKKTKYSEEEKARREELYERHSILFHLIFKIGNKVMLENQLIILCRKLGLVEYAYSDSAIRKVLKEMDKLGMIELTKWQANQRCNMIQLCDPFLTRSADYFTELLGYRHGGANDKTEGRFSASICRTEYIINMLHPNIRASNNLYEIENFFRYVDNNFSLYYQKGRGLEYLKKIQKKYGGELKLTKEEYDKVAYYNEEDFNNLVSRKSNATITFVSNEYLKGEGAFIDTLKQIVNVRIDVFDVNDKRQIDDLLITASKTIECFHMSLERRLELRKTNKCKNCPIDDCIRTFDATAGEYKKMEVDCTEKPFVLDRTFKYMVNIYSYDESGYIRITKDINERKTYRSGEKSEYSLMELILSKNTGVPFNNIQVNIKNLDIDRKYKKGKRGDKFKEINRERAIANTVEATLKETNKNIIDNETKELITTILSLPEDVRASTSATFNNVLKDSLKSLRNEVNTYIEKDI